MHVCTRACILKIECPITLSARPYVSKQPYTLLPLWALYPITRITLACDCYTCINVFIDGFIRLFVIDQDKIHRDSNINSHSLSW